MEIRINVIEKQLLSPESLQDMSEFDSVPMEVPDFVCVWGSSGHVFEEVLDSLTHPGLGVLSGLQEALVSWVPGNVYANDVEDRSLAFRYQMTDKVSEGYTACWVGYTKTWGGSSYSYTFEVLCYGYD